MDQEIENPYVSLAREILTNEEHSEPYIHGYAVVIADANEAIKLNHREICKSNPEAYNAGVLRARVDLADEDIKLNDCIIEQPEIINGCIMQMNRYELFELGPNHADYPQDQLLDSLVECLNDPWTFQGFFEGYEFRIARILGRVQS